TRLAAALTRSAMRHFDCITTVSERLAAEVHALLPEHDVCVLPSPINLTRFVPLDKHAARRALGEPGDGEKWILFNSLDIKNPVKRFRLARAAFDLAQARMGNLRLRIATGLPHERMPLFVAACDLILCTSESEGWPNCVKEALACNVPFVA